MDTIKNKEYKEMYKIVCSLLARPESAAFRDPVDWEGLQLLDYPDIVKKPMDLGTVKSKIETNKYTSLDEIAADIRLVWTNCMLYNCDGSEYYHLANKFSKGFEEAFRALRKLEEKTEDENRIPTIDEKLQLSHDIFKIGNAELAKVLTMIEESSPYAMSRKNSIDEVLINFDALPAKTFHAINAFVLNCLVNMTGNKKNKKRKSNADE